MRAVGIICEYNIFHNGHKRQIDLLKKDGFDTVVCVMSGNFTQRGSLAIADKYTRAKSAIMGGADLVFELPFPFSSLSAEGFAEAGVHILSSLGIKNISFGSECYDKELLKRAAKIIKSKEFIEKYSLEVKRGSAYAYFDTIKSILGEDQRLLSNDILAISYISAIEKLSADMEIFPIAREGSAYRDTELSGNLSSATALRQKIEKSGAGFECLNEIHSPKAVISTLKEAQKNCKCPVFIDKIGNEILSFFRFLSPDEIANRAVKRSGCGNCVADDGDGIVDRLCNQARASKSFDEFINSSYNSRHTDARIKRVMLFSLLGVSDKLAKELPTYTTLLATNKQGRELLSQIRRSNTFPIVTKPADAPTNHQSSISALADSIYATTMPECEYFDYFIKQSPYIADF